LVQNLSAPWVLNDDYNGAFWSQAAHNFFRAGWLASAGVPAPIYFGSLPIPPEHFYVHHPTLFPAVVALVFGILKEAEWAARLIPITCTLLSAAGLWGLVRRASGARAAALTLILFAALPMQLHYGRMVNFEALEMTLFVAALICWERWEATQSGVTATKAETGKAETRFPRDSQRRFWAVALATSLLLAMLTDWLGFLFTLLFAGKLFLGRKHRRFAGVLFLLMTAAGMSFLLQIRLADPNAWSELARCFKMRLGSSAVQNASVPWSAWVPTVGGFLAKYFPPLCWLLAFAGAWLCIRRRNELNPGERLLAEGSALLSVMNLIYLVGLHNQSFIHDFASYYLSIPVAVLAGMAIERILSALSRRQGRLPALASPAAVVFACGMMFFSIHQLKDIDSPFGILDDADDEPLHLMTSLGKKIRKNFPPNQPILCNFDEANSPLAYYAQHPLITGLHTQSDWEQAEQDQPGLAGEVIWLNGPDAANILKTLPPGHLKKVVIAGIPFSLWTPLHAGPKAGRRSYRDAGNSPRSQQRNSSAFHLDRQRES
jgi:hypothetical protein